MAANTVVQVKYPQSKLFGISAERYFQIVRLASIYIYINTYNEIT